MFFWRTGELSRAIKENRISPNEWKNYYLAVSIVMTISMYFIALTPRLNLTAMMVEAFFMIGVVIFGVSITYVANNGDSGTDYVPRMVALTLPITIKLFVLSLVFGIVIGVLSEVPEITEMVIEWIFAVFAVFIQVIFFWRINAHLRYINA